MCTRTLGAVKIYLYSPSKPVLRNDSKVSEVYPNYTILDLNEDGNYLSFCITCPRKELKEKGSIYLVTHKVRHVVKPCKQNKGENQYVTRLPQLSLPHSPPTPLSLVCLLHTLRKPTSGSIRI